MFFVLLLSLSVCIGDAGNGNPSGEELRNAFLLTVAAGLSTVIGAGVACFVKWEDLKGERSTFLAAWLSFAAAVMLYVSLVEIWHESLLHFEETTGSAQLAHIYTSISFFGGVALGFLFTKIVICFENVRGAKKQTSQSGAFKTTPSKLVNDMNNPEMVQMRSQDGCGNQESQKANESVVQFKDVDERKTQLLRTAIVTAISIALHNFPEGIVTFLAALANWKVGVATAFAIAMHNIPEGICIAIPYYYASESRWKAFAIAFLSGVAEPIGALLGWAIFDDVWGPEVFGLMFGLTAGIMVYISFHELLPLARRNDPEDKVTTIMIFVGMLVMDMSLFIAA